MIAWRILHVDWYDDGLLAWRAQRLVRDIFGPMVPWQIYGMLARHEFGRIIRGFTLSK